MAGGAFSLLGLIWLGIQGFTLKNGMIAGFETN
jgi:hypothetical protein